MKRYVVIFHPRSGSSWLSSIMSGFPDILEGFELLDFQTANNLGFGSDHLKNESMTYRHIYTIGEFFKHAEKYQKIRLAGFKAAPYQIYGLGEFASHLRSIDAHVILLTRSRILGAAISSIGALALHKRQADVNIIDPSHSVKKVRVGRDELFYNLTEQIIERNRVLAFRDVFDRNRLLEVRYEMMCDNTSRQMRRIFKFLSFEVPKGAIFQGVTHRNLLPSPAQSVENYDEVVGWLKGTLFEWVLDEN